MGLLVTLLCLGLLFQGQSTVYQVISPITPIAKSGQAGAVLNIPLGTYPETYPIEHWILSHWIFVIDLQESYSFASHISNPDLGIYWAEGLVLFFILPSSQVQLTYWSLPLSKWMYMAMGMNGAGSAFGVVRLRGEDLYKLTLATSAALTSGSVFDGSYESQSFTVRGYTGLFSGRKAHG